MMNRKLEFHLTGDDITELLGGKPAKALVDWAQFHLERCPECRELVSSMEEVVAALKKSGELPTPPVWRGEHLGGKGGGNRESDVAPTPLSSQFLFDGKAFGIDKCRSAGLYCVQELTASAMSQWLDRRLPELNKLTLGVMESPGRVLIQIARSNEVEAQFLPTGSLTKPQPMVGSRFDDIPAHEHTFNQLRCRTLAVGEVEGKQVEIMAGSDGHLYVRLMKR